jgi:hypothetical protein
MTGVENKILLTRSSPHPLSRIQEHYHPSDYPAILPQLLQIGLRSLSIFPYPCPHYTELFSNSELLGLSSAIRILGEFGKMDTWGTKYLGNC